MVNRLSVRLLMGLFGLTGMCTAQVFTNRAAWQAAVARNATIDFTTAAPPPAGSLTTYPAPPGLTLNGITFSSNLTVNNMSNVSVVSKTYCCATYNRGFASLSSNSSSTGNVIGITLSNGSTAFGFDYFMVISGDLGGTIPGQGVVNVGNINYQIFGPFAPQKSFFGFISPAPIVGTIQISGYTPALGASASTQVDVMNFSYDTSGEMQRNIGYFKPSDPSWALDFNGNGQFDASDRVFPFAGQPGAVAVTGDWNGDGRTKVGYYINGFWVLDYNGNGTYDGVPGGDKFYAFGGSGASYVPVVGDWNGDGKTKIGFYNNGFWALDVNGNGTFDGVAQDSFFGFGGNGVGEMPVLGDWNGNGRTKIGYFYQGKWVLDYDGNGIYTAVDKNYQTFPYSAGDIPVYGDWSGDGKTKIGIYRGGFWILDYNGNGTYDGVGAGSDKFYGFGGNAGEMPLVADWNGNGTSKIGVYVNGFWVLDFNGNGTYDGTGPGGDRFIAFGGSGVGYQPIIGRW